MERKYRHFRNRIANTSEYGKLPLLEVRLSHGENYIDVDCLVDSGAVDSMFHTDVADELGIDLQGLEEREYFGIDGKIMPGRIAPIQLHVKGLVDPIDIEVAFVEGNEIPLLGQSGFFDNYEIRFQRFKGRFEILPVSARTSKYLM
jgi:hypothetical protein